MTYVRRIFPRVDETTAASASFAKCQKYIRTSSRLYSLLVGKRLFTWYHHTLFVTAKSLTWPTKTEGISSRKQVLTPDYAHDPIRHFLKLQTNARQQFVDVKCREKNLSAPSCVSIFRARPASRGQRANASSKHLRVRIASRLCSKDTAVSSLQVRVGSARGG